MGMKRTHRRRRCGQSTCNPRAPTKISAPMEPRLACERFCDHGRRHTLHRRSIPAPGSRIRAIPSAHPSRRNGVPRHRVVAFGGKTADQAPRPPPTGPQGGRRGLVIALHRRHWRGRAFRLRPQPERPPGCRRRGLRLVACHFGPLSIRILYARRVAQRRAMLMRVAVLAGHNRGLPEWRSLSGSRSWDRRWHGSRESIHWQPVGLRPQLLLSGALRKL